MISHYYAMLFRMKYINRWALMRNNRTENLSEHSLEVAFIAHSLAVIENRRFGGDFNAERVALLAMFHDTPEIITGDLPTPIKYYNRDIKNAYKEIEQNAINRLTSMIPEDLRQDFLSIYNDDDEKLKAIVKAADKLSALIKCVDEISTGNKEFEVAEKSTRKIVEEISLPSVKVFLNEFLPSFSLSLDEQGK
ncbi:MAG: 5'-deoxynucleotidase [Oscillospiraceae bacterium]|nr:5'-deoxynucleotidase [Oscillospiraceae bacterium]